MKISLLDVLAHDRTPLRAPPSWINAEIATVNDQVVLHGGAGKLDGAWHRQDSDEFLLVLRGSLIVEFGLGPVTAGPGEGILISSGERHRATVPEDCLLLSVEGIGMTRVED
ncbi:MAG TPA: cupin domain-containing protein [Candidatus Limnocylindria bacterium]|jgi:quercetin dioxygenase-like cupin family protein